MKKEKKIPRFTLKHGAYYWTPTVDGVTKWIRLSKDRDEALLMYEGKEGGPVDRNVRDMLKLYKESKQWAKLAPETKRVYDIHIRNLNKHMGSICIEEVDATMMSRFIDKIGWQGNQCVSVLSGAYKRAVLEGWINYNPANKGDVTKADIPYRERHVLKEELLAIREAGDQKLKDFIDIALQTAARKGDILGLDESCVTERGLVITVSKRRAAGRVLEFAWTPELRRAAAKIPLNFSVTALRSAWERARKKAGIPDLRIHDIRRFCIQEARRQNRSGQALADHQSQKQTEGYLRGAPIPMEPLALDIAHKPLVDFQSEVSH